MLKSQLLKKDRFYGPPAMFAQYNIGTEINPDAGLNLYHAEDNYNQGKSQNVSCFKDLTKDDILQPHLSQKHFLTKNVKAVGQIINDIGYICFDFDIRYQKFFLFSTN